MDFKKNIANFVTSIRIFGAVALIFLEPLKLPFFLVYAFCGLSDAVDGFIARKLKITSELGSKLDSVADLSFYSVMMIKIFDSLTQKLILPLWIFLFLVLIIRVSAYLVSAFKLGVFSSLHTILNKITGGGVFFLPFILGCSSYAVNTVFFNIYGGIVCLVAFAASLQELLYYVKK